MIKCVVDSRYEHHRDFICSLPERISRGEGDVVYEGRNKVVRFTNDGLVMIVKRFKRANPVQRFAYTVYRPSKAARAYSYVEIYRSHGIDTPDRVAFIEDSPKGWFRTGYFVSCEATGESTMTLLRDREVYDPQLAEAVARQVYAMHSQGILHGDLNLSNFLCRQTADGYRFTMIDLNRSRFTVGIPSYKRCMTDLVRITHRRDLYCDLISRYAQLRGWDVRQTVDDAIARLDKFEARRLHL